MNKLLYKPAVICVIFLFVLLPQCGGGGGDSKDPGPDGTGDLAIPANVTADGGDLSITVSWSAVTGANGYRIYYKSSPGVSTADPNLDAFGTTSVDHNNLDDGVTISAASSVPITVSCFESMYYASNFYIFSAWTYNVLNHQTPMYGPI